MSLSRDSWSWVRLGLLEEADCEVLVEEMGLLVESYGHAVACKCSVDEADVEEDLARVCNLLKVGQSGREVLCIVGGESFHPDFELGLARASAIRPCLHMYTGLEGRTLSDMVIDYGKWLQKGGMRGICKQIHVEMLLDDRNRAGPETSSEKKLTSSSTGIGLRQSKEPSSDRS